MSSYYDVAAARIVDIDTMGLSHLNDAELRKQGIYRVVVQSPEYNKWTEKIFFGGIECNGTVCYQSVTVVQKALDEIVASLIDAKRDTANRFCSTFAELDTRRARPAAAVAEALGLGEPPLSDDVNILGQLNMIAEENREILQSVEFTTIPEGAAYEEAVAILRQVLDTKPWWPGV